MTMAQTKSGAQGPARYDNVAIALHWLIAAAVVTNIALGLYMGDLPRTDPMKFAIVHLHISIGLTVLMLSVLRVLWRLLNPAPPLPADMAPVLQWAAKGVHVLFYVLILALPLTGWLMESAAPRGGPLPYFGLFDWPQIGFLADMALADKKAVVGIFAESHETLAWIMIVLIPIHVAAALYHQFVLRDDVLQRMRPGG